MIVVTTAVRYANRAVSRFFTKVEVFVVRFVFVLSVAYCCLAHFRRASRLLHTLWMSKASCHFLSASNLATHLEWTVRIVHFHKIAMLLCKFRFGGVSAISSTPSLRFE